MVEYFVFGLGLYIGMCINNPTGFVKATAAGLLRGILLCILLWPIGLIVGVVSAIEKLRGCE